MSSQFQLDLADVEAKLALIPEDVVRDARKIIQQKGNRYAGSLVLAIVQLQRAQCLEAELEKQRASQSESDTKAEGRFEPRLGLANG